MNNKYNIGISTRIGLQTVYQLFGSLFTLVLGFPLYLFVARRLGADELGLFAVSAGVMGLIATVLGFGLAPALASGVPRWLEHRQYDRIRHLVSKGGKLLLAAGVLAAIGSWLLLPVVRRYVPAVDAQPFLLTAMSWMIPLGMLTVFLQQGLRGFEETGFVVFCNSVVRFGAKAVLAVLLLSLGLGLGGLVAAVIISTMTGCAMLALLLWRKLVALPAQDAAATITADDSWPGHARRQYLNSLAAIGTTWLDQLVLALLAGPAPVGILLIVRQLQQVPTVLLQLFMTLITPLSTAADERGDDDERQHMLHFTIDWLVRLSLPLCVFLVLFAHPLLELYGDDFAAAGTWPLRLLVLAQLPVLVTGPLVALLVVNDGGKMLRKLALMEMVLLVVGLWLLVPRFGLTGAAAVLAFNTLWLNAFTARIASRHLALGVWDRRYWGWALPLATVTIAGLAVKFYGPGNPGLAMLLLILVLGYVLFNLMCLLQGLHRDDRAVLAHIGMRVRDMGGVRGVLKYMLYQHVLSRVADLRGRGVYSMHADKFQCIFIHIPKAAGTSVAQTLFNRASNHVTWFDYYHANPDKFRRYYKFSFVRNPWDRLASTYFFLQRGGMTAGDAAWAKANLGPYPTFESFVKGWLNDKNIYSWEHFRPQHYFICDEDGKVQMDFVGRVENMDADFAVVAARLGCTRALARVNVGNLQHYSTYYTDEMREIVARVYARDIELFGYHFERANGGQP